MIRERPPVRLRRELERRRARGRPFRCAWPIAVNAAVGGLSPGQAARWRQVFSETRGAWAANYGGPNLRKRFFAIEREHSGRPDAVLVA